MRERKLNDWDFSFYLFIYTVLYINLAGRENRDWAQRSVCARGRTHDLERNPPTAKKEKKGSRR